MSCDKIVRWDLEGLPGLAGPYVVAIGVFDGVHAGHRALLAAAAADARARGVSMAVVTFERDPDELFAESLDKLQSDKARLELLAELTGGTLVVLPASRRIFALAPDAFLDALGSALDPVAVHVGSNFRFGADAAGTIADIERWCAKRACSCTSHDLVVVDGEVVSSTRIRGLVRAGRVEHAARLLGGRAHSVLGTVVHGRGEGTGMGFATANLDLSDNGAMLPKEGVYAGYARVHAAPVRSQAPTAPARVRDLRDCAVPAYPAAVNLGRAASFEAASALLEAHLLGFAGDLYGCTLEVSFVERLRDMRRFDSVDELAATVQRDIAQVRERLGGSAQWVA